MSSTNNPMDILIEQLVKCRKDKNLSQRALAYLSHIPQSTLARIETGRTVPQLDTLIKIADSMNMELNLQERKVQIPELNRWDGLEFSVYWKNELMTRVKVKETRVDVTRFVLHPVKQIFYSDRMDIYQLSCILEDRCWDRGRADINDILRELGLKYYDPLEIVKKTHGVSYNDFLWFQFAGEKYRYEDMMSGRCKQ